MRFSCTSNISDGLRSALEAQDPANPMYASQYLQAMLRLGMSIVIVGLWDDQNVACACPAIIRRGRLNRSLEVESLPEIPQPDLFWAGFIDYCRGEKMTDVRIGTFGSRSAAIPLLPGETERTPRWEFIIELTNRDLLMTLNATHRQRVRKAEKNGVTLLRSRDVSALNDLSRLAQASMERRSARGEGVPTTVELDSARALIQEGAAEVFMAIKSGRAISSGVVVRASRGAYLHASGTDPEGMSIGASHFLNYSIAKSLQDESLDLYNLGGAGDLESGLAHYKLNFGSRVIPLEAVSLNLGSAVRKRFTALANELRSISSRAVQRVTNGRRAQDARVAQIDK